ncbi:MAG TPA: sigma-70 family RNA polymerase sigma factor [Acidimicrobiales bacterium]
MATPGAGESFDELFRREREPMVRVAYLIAGSTAVAEEVAHDAFVTVFERWDRLDQPGAYLRRCVVNGAMRASRRRAHGERLAAAAAPPGEVGPGFDDTLDAVRRLAPRARALVVLRYYAQLTTQEIADVLQIPQGTVKSGLHRALADLREVLVR